jgi:type II secretory pathway component PulJ
MKNKLKYHLKRQQVFTLIEVVLAVSIMMMVFLVAGTGLMIVQQTWVKSQNRSARLKELILVDKIVNSTFTNIIPFEWKDDQLKKREIFLGDPNKVTFATTHRLNIIQEGSIRFVSIYIEDSALIASYSNTPILPWDDQATPQISEIIAEGVANVEFQYADFDSKRVLIWDSDWDEEKRRNIPLAIQMTVTWEDQTQTSWLKRTAGAGKRENFGRRYKDRLE